jgi:hypothetical protein
MTIKKCIEKEYSQCAVAKCNENSCKMKFNKIGAHIIIKGESISKGNFKICDYLVFIDNDSCIICSLELRSNNIDHPTEIQEKLENSVPIIKSILEKCKNKNLKIKYYPILLSKSIDRFQEHFLTAKTVNGEKNYSRKLRNPVKNYS